MSTRYQEIIPGLQADPKTWLVTGCAGFIGSNLLEALLLLDQKVVGLDNFSTGHQHNLDEVQKTVSARQRSEEHTSELQSLMRISYAVFCLKKKKIITTMIT